MKIDIYSIEKKYKIAGSIELSDKYFSKKYREDIIHQLVLSHNIKAKYSISSKKQKNRSEVQGSGIKPWKQKGTGRARAGSKRSPIWKGGGRAFPNTPKVNKYKINKKVYHLGMQSIFSFLLKENRIFIFDKIKIDSPNTKKFNLLIRERFNNNVLIINDYEKNIFLSSRNIPNIHFITKKGINPLDLLKYKNILINYKIIKEIEEIWLKK